MLNLIAARAPSLLLFGTMEAAFVGFVWSQWQTPSELRRTSFRSAIPQGHIGSGRFQLPTAAHA